MVLLSQRTIPLATVWEVSKRVLQLISSVDNVQQPAQRQNIRYVSKIILCQVHLHLHVYTHHYHHCMYLHVCYSLTRRCSVYALKNNTSWIMMTLSWTVMIRFMKCHMYHQLPARHDPEGVYRIERELIPNCIDQCNWVSTLVLSCFNCSISM